MEEKRHSTEDVMNNLVKAILKNVFDIEERLKKHLVKLSKK